MAKSTKSAGVEVESFIQRLQSLLDALPSESQKQEINNAFTELISFLTDMQNLFLAMPSTEDSASIRVSLEKLAGFYASAQKVPIIAASVGAGQKSTKRSSGASSKEEIDIDVNEVLASLTKLSADEIRSQLDGNAYSKHSLRLIASEMGLKTASGATRKRLAEKIANDIVNQRMRDSLAGRSNRESAVG
ncbi:MAG TPA: hypothetical protein VJ810_23200 [Blastocatellia bacterium]|nr:hypothetical protein [Blastocatellia bacterium]